jgi:ligand-binding SRPBCC domain-containing protein
MPEFHLRTLIAASPETCFDLERDVGVHEASTNGTGERAIAGVTSGKMDLGDEVTWEARHFGLKLHMTSRIVAFDSPRALSDEMQRGPFAYWRHQHRFERQDGGTLMVDDVQFSSPLGPLGALVDAIILRRYLRNLLRDRNAYIKKVAEGMP